MRKEKKTRDRGKRQRERERDPDNLLTFVRRKKTIIMETDIYILQGDCILRRLCVDN